MLFLSTSVQSADAPVQGLRTSKDQTRTSLMTAPIRRRRLWLAALISSLSMAPQISSATIVTFDTVLGEIQVNLYDNATPATVANFLTYVQNGNYNGAVFHRSVAGFIVQGGGFAFNTQNGQVEAIAANPAVTNEPVFANVRGTIAMAKLGGDPNSATNQWFFNLDDNTANLDGQNGGFTAFGEVIGNGMAVVDAIAALQRFNLSGNLGSAFAEVPLQGNTSNNPLDATNYIIVNSVSVTDTTVDSAGAAGLNPPLTTANSGGGGGALPPPSSGGGGGGGFGFIGLLGLLFAIRYKSSC